MTKRLFALFLTLVMVLQPVLPAAAETVGEDTAVLAAEETVETTEAVEETEEVTEETTEAAEEPTEEATEEAAEETEAATEESEATEETEVPTEESTEPTEENQETDLETEPTQISLSEQPFQGKGTEEEPYVLSSEEELALLAALVNDGEADFAEAWYVLGADLTLMDHTPIGTEQHPFHGHFNGSGHRMTGLTGGGGKYWGLFGVADGAVLSGIALEEVTISGTAGMTAGAVAGLLRSSCLEKSYAAGEMDAEGTDCLLGGLVGKAEDSTISDSFVQMTIMGYACVGGLTAEAENTAFVDCYAVGEIGCSDGDAFDALVGKAGEQVSFDNCYQVDMPGVHGQFLTVEEAMEDGFQGLSSEIWEIGSEQYPYPVLVDCPYAGDGYALPDMEENATGYREEGSLESTPNSYMYSRNYGSYPSKYITPNLPDVRNQNPYGSCWSFSSVAGAEASLIKKGLADSSINLAETQLVWFHNKGTKNDSGKYEDPLNNFGGDHNVTSGNIFDVGGNYALAGFSLASWIGLMEEDAQTAYTSSNVQSIQSSGLPYVYAFSKDAAVLDNVRQISMGSGINAIKQAITEYGGVSISYTADSRFMTGGNKYYYSSEPYKTDHAVFIVGWDDSISKSNFRDSYDGGTTPNRNGAWIVRNSWGSSWGDNGYFYMSYDSAYVSSSSFVGYAWDYTLAQDDAYLYQYDGTESGTYYTISGASTLKYANVFTAQGNDTLEAVSFWMNQMADVNYQIDVYTGVTSGNPVSGTRAATVSGTTDLAGYYTVALNSPVRLSKGTVFSLVVTLSGRSSYSIPCDVSANYGWTSAVSYAAAGQSYILMNGSWNDFGSGNNANFRIKGRVTRRSSTPTQSNIITASNITLVTDSTKAQTVSLNASALGGAALSYRSDNTSVTVSTNGTITVAKGFSGTAKITITAAETSVYKQTTAVITVQVISAGNVMDSGDYGTLHWELRESGTFALSGSGSMAYSESGYPWQRHVVSDIKSIIIENGVTSIAADAFWGCSALESLTLGNTVQEIGEYAFFGSALKGIIVPASVKSIAESALNTTTLQNIYVKSGNSTYCDVDGVLFTKNKDTLILFPQGRTGSYSVPSTVRTLAQAAFISSQLTQVQIPEGVTEIELACFASSQLSKVTLPSTLRTVGVNAFMFCSKLKSITIPGSVKSIGSSAFEKAGLEKVTIENGVTTIGEDAFISCPMMSVTLPASVASIGEHAIGYTYQSRAYQKIDGFMIYGTPGSAAQQYATSNGFTFESTSTPISNTITASNITLTTDNTKTQTVSLNASALGGAALSYRSDSASVTVSSSGIVTVAKGFVGTAKITITAAATSTYKQTTKTITVTVKANAETAATIKVESQNALTGKDVTVPVMLTKNAGIAGFGLTVKYDTRVLTLNSITAGSAISGNGTFSTNGNITTWYTVENTTVTGELMKLNFAVKENAAEGDTEVTVALTDGLDSNLSDEDGNPVSVAITAGKITVARGILGDVNGDGSVAIADVVLLNRAVLGKVTLADSAKKLGDVNGDGNISIADVVKLNRFVLKKVSVLAAPADSTVDGVVDFSAVPASITVGTVDGRAGQTVTVPVSISGNPGIAGYSLKVTYDANALTLNSMTAGSLISGNGTFSTNDEAHIVNWYTVDNLSGDGELLKLNFTVKDSAAEGTIPVSVSLNDGLDSNLSNEDGVAVPAAFTAGGVRVGKAQSGTFGNLTWRLSDDGTLTISGSGEMEYASSYPWDTYKDIIRKVVVENGVTSIGMGAFGFCDVLEEVVFSDTVETIEDGAFNFSPKLQTIIFGAGLQEIGPFAFEYCDSLEEITIPKSVKKLYGCSFEGDPKLQNIYVESGNTAYRDIGGVLFNSSKDTLIAFPGGRTGTYAIPGGVKILDRSAFYYSNLTEVVLPDGLTTIGDYCFDYSNISRMVLPGSLTTLGTGTFFGCKQLKTITIPGNIKTVPESAFAHAGLETVILENGITAIEKEAFVSCALTKVTVPSSVTDIGEHAFGYEVNRMDYNKIAGFTIVGLEGSAAQRYADSNGLQFEKIPMAIQLDIPDTVTAGTSIQLKAQVVPARYDTGKYIWSLKNAADSAYVTLSGNKLTAKTVPEVLNVVVVCTNGNLQAEGIITIVPTLAEIAVYHEEEPVSGSLTVDLNETETITLAAAAMPESAAMEPKWTWSDAKGAFGTYSQENGILTVKLNRYAKLGTITLTVTDQLTKKKAAVKLTTTRKSFGKIVILGAPGTMTGGSSLQLDALFSGSPTNTKVLWSLDEEDQAYASITPAGKLTAVQVTEEHTITVHAQAADGGSNGTSQVLLVPRVQTLGLLLDGETVEKSATIYLNDTKELCLAVNTWPEDASGNVTWTVSKNKIATAQTRSDGTLYLSRFTGETGVITVKAAAQDGSKKTASVQLRFARRPDSINILDSKGNKIREPITLKGKQSYSFKAEVRTQHGEKLTDKDVVWYVDSDDEGYVTLKNGKVSVRSFASSDPVTVFIEARVKSHPETKDRIELKLLPDQASGIYIDDVYNRKRLNDTTYTIDRSNVLFFLRARTVGLPDDTVVWSLAKPTDVVTIEEDGTVWLKKAGTATITAINPASKMKASFKLVVTNKVRKLTVSDAPSVLSGGKKAVLKAETVPVNPTNAKLTWFLLDNSGGAASITPAGVLTASKVTGVHTVKVAVMTPDAMDVSDPVEIRIIPAASRVVISGMPNNNTVDLNTCSSLKLTARVYPSVSAQKVNWSSSNKAVQVDENGNVSIFSGAKPGSVTLTATAADGSKKKATVKLNLVRRVTSVSMAGSAVVTGGKNLKLNASVDKSATNKKLVWSMTGDTAYCTLGSGTLKTKAVTTAKYVTIRATAADGSGVYAECNVTILPK